MLNQKQSWEISKVGTFLENVKAVFYYATPHHGTLVPERLRKYLPGKLLTYFQALNVDTARLNFEFDNLERVRNWKLIGVGEDHKTHLVNLNCIYNSFFSRIFSVKNAVRLFGMQADANSNSGNS